MSDAPSGPAVALEGIVVRYPGRREPALTGVDLSVAPGERVGITGRTGAGKSTLALVAGGFIPRVVRARLEGSAHIDGIDVAALDAGASLLGRVGIVFSTPANQLSASKPTVREELAFGLENLGVPRDEMDARIDGVLERLGIAHLADREPFALSGGEQQRVAIASIVAMGTRVLVLDEPTGQLDPAGTAQVGALLGELAAAGTAIVCVEHDPVILGAMDRVLVLDAGRVVGVDGPAVALGRSVAGTVGLPAPTLVRLAEAGGVEPERAFDEAAVAAGLRDAARTPLPTVTAASATAPGATDGWRPTDDRAVPGIEVEGLVHRYPGGVEAVRGVSLAIAPGSRVAILGQNGSGKTTLVKHLVGLLRPAAGEVRLDGRSIAADPVDELAATVGFVFQNPDDQLFERAVEREVAFGPRNLGLAADRTRALVDGGLAAVGLTDERTTNPYDLDLSRRKLVALASILAMDPAILVLDEPTTGQDAEGVARIGAVVAAWSAAGRTAIAITHDMEFAAAAFERIIVMRLGEVIADGPPATVLTEADAELLATTGLRPPPLARIAARLGLPSAPVDAETLLASLPAARPGGA
jgi:energy-coupling factor transporter ATP-binding protein EcfA2